MVTAGEELAARARDPAADPESVRTALGELLTTTPELGLTVAFDILAREPRYQPSRSLVIDPDEQAWRRWSLRVVAATVLLDSPVAATVFDELYDELAESTELARAVAVVARPSESLTAPQRSALQALAR